MANSTANSSKVAILTSLSGGLGHYAAHLAGPLNKRNYVKYITYPQLDQTGTTVKQITDSLVRQYIKWPRFDLDDNDPNSIIDLLDYLNSKEIKLINVHVGTTVKNKLFYFTTLCNYAKVRYKNKLILTLHDVLPFEEDKKIIKLLSAFYSFADAFTVGNIEEKSKLMKYYSIPEKKISIIPHGIYNLFNRNLYTQQMSKSYLNLPTDKKIILFFGFLREYKGFDYLINSAKLLDKTNHDYIIYVASGLKYASKDLLENYLLMINKLKLQDRFVLNLNYLDSSELEPVFKASDLVVLPYTHVSQSGVLELAFGFKKPVVITDCFHEKIWVDDKAGLVAKTADSQSLAQKISTLLDDRNKREVFGEYGFTYSSTHFSWEESANKFSKLFATVSIT